MACRAATGFVFHDLDFSQGHGVYLVCKRCQALVSVDRFLSQQCVGTAVERPASGPPVVPSLPGGVRCVLCGEPVQVDPRHRQHVLSFGACCDACFNQEAAHV